MKKIPILISYPIARDLTAAERSALFKNPKLDIMLDSGAFTAHTTGLEIDLDEYAEFVKKWRRELGSYFTLDVINDPKTTRANYSALYSDHGLNPIPVFTPGMRRRDLEKLYETSSIVAIGGVQLNVWSHGREKLLSYLKSVFKWANGRKLHLLGVAAEDILRTFKPHSCDCSNWTYSFRFGDVKIYLGNGRWEMIQSDRKKAGVNRKRVSTVDREVLETIKRPLAVCGYCIEDLFDEANWTYKKGHTHFGILLTAYSWIQYVREFYERFGVTIYLVTWADEVQSEAILRAVQTLQTETSF